MDRLDRALLAALQADSARSLAELAETCGLSPSACHRRIKALEAAGIVTGYAARIDGRALGLPLQAYVEITLASQSREAMDRFEAAVGTFDDILECHLMSGAADYLLRVAAPDLDGFDAIHRECLARLPGVASMRSAFVIRPVKPWRGYPVAR